MAVGTELLTETVRQRLAELSRNRGIYTGEVDETLRMVCGISSDTDPHSARTALRQALTDAAKQFPHDLVLPGLAALNLIEDIRSDTPLKTRMLWLAGTMDRDLRTARRRSKDALLLLAQALVAGYPAPDARPPPAASSPWSPTPKETAMAPAPPTPDPHDRAAADATSTRAAEDAKTEGTKIEELGTQLVPSAPAEAAMPLNGELMPALRAGDDPPIRLDQDILSKLPGWLSGVVVIVDSRRRTANTLLLLLPVALLAVTALVVTFLATGSATTAVAAVGGGAVWKAVKVVKARTKQREEYPPDQR